MRLTAKRGMRHRAALALAAGAGLLLGAAGARADVRYTTAMVTASDSGSGADTSQGKIPLMRRTTFVKDRRERVETAIQAGPVKMNTVTLTLCDKHQTIKLDPALKIYTVAPIGAVEIGMPALGRQGGVMSGESAPAEKPGTGKIVSTFHVQDLGSEKVADVTAHHFLLSIHTQQSGCIGDSDTDVKMETWVAPIQGALNCPERTAPSRTYTNERGCQITYEMKGDVDALKDIFGGMIVRQKIYSGDKVVMTQELRDYSTAALDSALFEPPADFKQVSEAEFEQAERQAMMKSIMGGGSAAPETPSADAAPESKSESAPQNTSGDTAHPSDTGTSGDNPKQDDSQKKEKKRNKIKIPGLPF